MVEFTRVAFVGGEGGTVFSRNDNLIAEVRAGVEPFADPEFGLLRLIIVRCVDEVAALIVVIVEDLERFLLGHFTHKGVPEEFVLT